MDITLNTRARGTFAGVIEHGLIRWVPGKNEGDLTLVAYSIHSPQSIALSLSEAEARSLLLQLNHRLGQPLAPRLPGEPAR